MMLDIILAVYLILIVISAIYSQSKSKDYLSKDVTTSLRGIAAVGIILHHMSERTTGGILFPHLGMIGYLLVALFFFLSGYGLIVQYKKNPDGYLKGFLKKRLLYIVIVYLIDILAYVVYGLLSGKTYTVMKVLRSVYRSGIAMNSWYMVALIVFYIEFYLIFRFAKAVSLKWKIAMMFGAQMLFFAGCLVVGRSGVWYLSNLGFSAGMIWAYNKEKIDGLLKKKYLLCLAVSVAAFLLFYLPPPVIEHFCGKTPATEAIRTFFRLFSSPLSVCMLVTVLYKFKPDTVIWRFAGTISLEIYLIHGMVYDFLRGPYVQIGNEALWTLLTIVISVALAYPVNMLNNKIASLLKK